MEQNVYKQAGKLVDQMACIEELKNCFLRLCDPTANFDFGNTISWDLKVLSEIPGFRNDFVSLLESKKEELQTEFNKL